MSLASPSLSSAPHTVVVVLDEASVPQGLAELRRGLSVVLGVGGGRLVVDVTRLDRISSSVVAALLRAKRTCLARGADVVVRGCAGQSLGLLDRTGLAAVLDIEIDGRR